MEKLTMQEEEVMIYIWELESCYVKDIVAKFEQPTPPYTTVASIVKNLERKKYVKAQRVGNNGVCCLSDYLKRNWDRLKISRHA